MEKSYTPEKFITLCKKNITDYSKFYSDINNIEFDGGFFFEHK